MAFDECTPFPATEGKAEASMERSMRWAKRSRDAFDAGGEHAERAALFGIQQGSMFEPLRRRSSEALLEIAVRTAVDGVDATGGRAVIGHGEEITRVGELDGLEQLVGDAEREAAASGESRDGFGNGGSAMAHPLAAAGGAPTTS